MPSATAIDMVAPAAGGFAPSASRARQRTPSTSTQPMRELGGEDPELFELERMVRTGAE